jgi:DNA-binding transcriptional ArsR family regulator
VPQQIETAPTIGTARVEIRTSDVVELLAAVCGIGWRGEHTIFWLAEAEAALGVAELDRIEDVCRPFRHGADFLEFAASLENLDEVDALLDFIAGLDERMLAYHLLGRMYKVEEIPSPLSTDGVLALLEQTDTLDSAFHAGASYEWADDVETTRSDILSVLRSVWEGFLRDWLPSGLEQRNRQRSDLAAYARRHGGITLWRNVTDHDELPMEVPEGTPYTRVCFVPSCSTGAPSTYVFGHGAILVIVDCARSIYEVERRQKDTESMIGVLKALADKNRLRILKLITRKSHKVNGKQIAEHLELSASVISRHLGQLKQAGLISEQSQDNRTITYEVNADVVAGISEALAAYLDDEKPEARESAKAVLR